MHQGLSLNVERLVKTAALNLLMTVKDKFSAAIGDFVSRNIQQFLSIKKSLPNCKIFDKARMAKSAFIPSGHK